MVARCYRTHTQDNPRHQAVRIGPQIVIRLDAARSGCSFKGSCGSQSSPDGSAKHPTLCRGARRCHTGRGRAARAPVSPCAGAAVAQLALHAAPRTVGGFPAVWEALRLGGVWLKSTRRAFDCQDRANRSGDFSICYYRGSLDCSCANRHPQARVANAQCGRPLTVTQGGHALPSAAAAAAAAASSSLVTRW